MNAFTTPTTVDYDAIVEELIGDVKTRLELIENCRLIGRYTDRSQFIREFKTIGFMNSRQTGKSAWVVQQFRKRPEETTVICLNNEIRNAIMHDAKSDDKSRFVTAVDILNCLKCEESKPRVGKVVIVNDSMYVLDRLGYRNLYNWLGRTEGEEPWVILT